jgi:hypothetical protein
MGCPAPESALAMKGAMTSRRIKVIRLGHLEPSAIAFEIVFGAYASRHS